MARRTTASLLSVALLPLTMSLPGGQPPGTAGAAARATATPTITSLPAEVMIGRLRLLHRAHGRWKRTATVRLGERARVEAAWYTDAGSISRPASATLLVSREGATVYEATKAASSIRVAGTFTWPVRFTDPALRGPLVARVTVYLANVAEQSLAFQLVG